MKKVIVQFIFPGLSAKTYEKSWEELRAIGHPNPKGLLHHVAGVQGKNVIVYDVWESLEAFHKFGEILLPILKKVGFPDNKPVITPVHYEYWGLKADLTNRKVA
jgi:hypothetical protein